MPPNPVISDPGASEMALMGPAVPVVGGEVLKELGLKLSGEPETVLRDKLEILRARSERSDEDRDEVDLEAAQVSFALALRSVHSRFTESGDELRGDCLSLIDDALLWTKEPLTLDRTECLKHVTELALAPANAETFDEIRLTLRQAGFHVAPCP